MAFTLQTFAKASPTSQGTKALQDNNGYVGSPAFWSYFTEDTAATVLVDDYFSPVAPMLTAGDLIFVYSSADLNFDAAVRTVHNASTPYRVTISTSGTGEVNSITATAPLTANGLSGVAVDGSVTVALTTPLSLAFGGTNAALTASNGGIFYSTATAGAILAGNATASKMLLSGSSAAPTWSTSTIPTSAGATAGKVLASNGTNYVLSSAAFPTSVGAVGTILRSDGTNWAATTATYPATTTINQLLYSSAANVIGGVTAGNNGVLISSAGGVPSWLAAGTTGQVVIATTGSPASWGTLSGIAVTSITGTANQINASASTGAVTLSLSSTIITPGTLAINSMTQGSVLFTGASSVVSQDNARFFWDNTNHRLGISTTTPTYQMEIKGAGLVTDGIRIGAADYTSTPNPGSVADTVLMNQRGFNMCTDGNSVGASYQPTLGIGMASSRSGFLLGLKANGGYALGIENGRVGILTATPLSAVDIASNLTVGSYAGSVAAPSNGLAVSGQTLIGTSASTGGATKLAVVADAAQSAFAENGQLYIGGASNPNLKLMIGMDTTSSFAWLQANEAGVGTKSISLNPAGGNVGVGTTNPLTTFQLAAASTLPSNETGSLLLQGTTSGGVARLMMGINYSTTMAYAYIQALENGVLGRPLCLLSTGLGVGSTTAPLNAMDVFGKVAIGSYAGTAAAPTNGLIVSGAVAFGRSSQQGTFQVSIGTEGLFIQSTTNPQYLSFDSSGNNGVRIQGAQVFSDSAVQTSKDLSIGCLTAASTYTEVLRAVASGTAVSIGNASPDASAKLQVDSTVSGFLPPRMTTTQKNAISSPIEGLVVYDTTLHKLCVRTVATWETITSV